MHGEVEINRNVLKEKKYLRRHKQGGRSDERVCLTRMSTVEDLKNRVGEGSEFLDSIG